jgi:hypothetical protein
MPIFTIPGRIRAQKKSRRPRGPTASRFYVEKLFSDIRAVAAFVDVVDQTPGLGFFGAHEVVAVQVRSTSS